MIMKYTKNGKAGAVVERRLSGVCTPEGLAPERVVGFEPKASVGDSAPESEHLGDTRGKEVSQ